MLNVMILGVSVTQENKLRIEVFHGSQRNRY